MLARLARHVALSAAGQRLARGFAPVAAPALLLGFIAAASAWLLHSLDDTLLAAPEGSRHAPDLYLEDFVTTTMDATGKPARRVEATYMAHFADTDTHELTAPSLQIFRDDSAPWQVRSERGWLSANGDVMLLLGKVHIWRGAGGKARGIDIKTADLRVLPETDYGETDKPVVITTLRSQSRAVGMRAFLDQGRLELLSRVHTVVERPGAD